MRTRQLAALLFLSFASVLAQEQGDELTLCRRETGYRGVWYANQPSKDEYAYKYSGGLGTYCAKHQPFAVYCAQVDRTFFCYGGAPAGNPRRLLHAVSWFDHRTGEVPRPVVLLDKRTGDAHDNPVLCVDGKGYLWVFSTSHGRSRPSYLHRSTRPFDVRSFERVKATYLGGDGQRLPLDNFSYMQAWHVPGGGFACFFTRYGDPAARTSMFMTSADGLAWSRWRRLAAIELGHYQVSAAEHGVLAAVCNYHPAGRGLNWRTNLYYVESRDGGRSWQTADAEPLELPLAEVGSPALVRDYRAEGRLVYLKDLRIEPDGSPVVLYLTSGGYAAGPANGPRTWTIARRDEGRWVSRAVTTSDNNYDMGSLWLDDDAWRIVAPTAPGPQAYNPGGEMELWRSDDRGETWTRVRRLTAGSARNHTYARRPVNAHPGFFALWADGDARRPSSSRLHFCNRSGDVFVLPEEMAGERARPVRVSGPSRPK